MNVFDFAMQMEDNGYDYYTGLAKAATVPGLKTIFTDLAEDEKKHLEIFRALKEGRRDQKLPESKTLETAKNVFLLLPRGKQVLEEINGPLPSYQHAMKLEAESFRFYEEAAEKEEDAEVKALLLKIAAEEHRHFNILENVFHFVNAPNQHLEWGEFSNLGEFRQYGRDTDI
ncbi:ferritin family protein [Deltaproteobacteria bacterium IMCC39524]|nr:ferritin family protein [Deltaproteobacteria bacterium IMCC39524]